MKFWSNLPCPQCKISDGVWNYSELLGWRKMTKISLSNLLVIWQFCMKFHKFWIYNLWVSDFWLETVLFCVQTFCYCFHLFEGFAWEKLWKYCCRFLMILGVWLSIFVIFGCGCYKLWIFEFNPQIFFNIFDLLFTFLGITGLENNLEIFMLGSTYYFPISYKIWWILDVYTVSYEFLS